jgi:iron complex outermembrane receptor protein
MRLRFPIRTRALCHCAALPLGASLAVGASMTLHAQDARLSQLDPVVVTATRSAKRAFDLPVAINTAEKDQIQRGQLEVKLSESLARIPGMSPQNRWNYAADLQLSVRGFGAHELWCARRAALPRLHSGDDAGRAGPDRQH